MKAAAAARPMQALRLLVRAGARLDSKNEVGHTPLMIASARGNLRAVRGLLQLGAAPDVANRVGETALSYAIVWRRRSVVTALLRAGASVQAPRGAWSPLMLAAFEGDTVICRRLLDSGASARQRDRYGRDASAIAAWAGHKRVAALLRADKPSQRKRDRVVEVDQVIALRTLFRKTGAQYRPVHLRLYRPYEQPNRVWACEYEVEGLDDHKWGPRALIFGADSMQALLLAMKVLGEILFTSPSLKARRLFERPNGRPLTLKTLGLPKFRNIRPLPPAR